MIGGAEELLGISPTLAILLAVAGVVLLVAGVSAIVMSRRRPPDVPDIPPAMQPGPSDADLEKPLLEKLQGWGLLLVVFFVIWMPVVWLLEPSANVDDENELRQTSIDRGENAVQLFSEENPGGVGCVQCHGPGLSGGQNLFQGNVVTVPPLVNVCARLTLDQIKTTIEQGRPSTDMPSWSIRFQGALNDQQISEILDYVVELNRDNVPMEENKCLNPLAGTTPTASPTASPTP